MLHRQHANNKHRTLERTKCTRVNRNIGQGLHDESHSMACHGVLSGCHSAEASMFIAAIRSEGHGTIQVERQTI